MTRGQRGWLDLHCRRLALLHIVPVCLGTPQRTGLRLGDAFYEGEEIAEYPLTVVGILRPTYSANDRTIFFSLASFWGMNEVNDCQLKQAACRWGQPQPAAEAAEGTDPQPQAH